MIKLLFRSSAERQSEERIETLENQVESATGARRAGLLNRLADLHAEAGDARAAQACYGRAIDEYVMAGLTDAAAALCRKLIRRYPDVVRARATLAILYLGREPLGEVSQAIELIDEYVRVAVACGQQALAPERLRYMAGLVADPAVHLRIAELLEELGDAPGSRELRSGVTAAQVEGDEAVALLPEERWDRLLDSALAGPAELRQAGARRTA